jgi:hypothetical protein
MSARPNLSKFLKPIFAAQLAGIPPVAMWNAANRVRTALEGEGTSMTVLATSNALSGRAGR